MDRWGNLYTFCPIFSINRKLLKKPMDFFKVHILRLHLYKILEHQNTLYDSTGSMVTKDEEEEKSVQSLSQVCLFVNPWIAARQASLSITNSWRLLKLRSIELVMPSISSSVIPFSSHPQSFPASGSFQINQFFILGGQSIGDSASVAVFPMNIQE